MDELCKERKNETTKNDKSEELHCEVHDTDIDCLWMLRIAGTYLTLFMTINVMLKESATVGDVAQSHGERFRNAKFNPVSPGESFDRRTGRPPTASTWSRIAELAGGLHVESNAEFYTEFPPSRSLVDYRYNIGFLLQKFSKQNPEHRESQATVSFCDPFRLGLESGRFRADVKPYRYSNQSSMNLPERNPVAEGDANLSGVLSGSAGARRAQTSGT